jgi:RNA polymerase sigma-70 factor (ECF subfamily)
MKKENTMIDKPTIGRFKEGDSEAYATIYIAYKPKLIIFMQKHIKNGEMIEDVEDIAHDTFLLLWNNRVSIDIDKNLFAYTCTIGLNIISNKRRHNAIVRAHLLKETLKANIEQKTYSMEEEYIAQDILRYINLAMKKLTNRQLEVFYLLRNQGFTYKETAQKLGIRESTVESHVHKINEVLYKYLGDF